MSEKPWYPRGRDFDALKHREQLTAIFEAVRGIHEWRSDDLPRILAQHPRQLKGASSESDQNYYSKIELVKGYQQLTDAGLLPFERAVQRRLQMKPIRTSSGVAPVTVLTQPAGCPGRCIFCPDADGMPKSYLPNEPGARRAAQCGFDPYLQTRTRLNTFEAMGHTADKVELLILGGTWSAYSKHYREQFVLRCLDAINEPEPASSSLADAQARNETAARRNVGLVIETRPDWVTLAELSHLRRLGVTKVQLGVQSLDDKILTLNQRGHDVEAVRRALRLLRGAGFKLHVHWMPNLHGATPESDRADFARLWSDPALRPDELKIYPCSIIEGTELYTLWRRGDFIPYTDDELIELVADCKTMIPSYCRVNRVFRDIPADDIVAGSKRSNLRQLVKDRLAERGQQCGCIRCREVRGSLVDETQMRRAAHTYETDTTTEVFMSYETETGQIAGFLRLSLPRSQPRPETSEVWSAIPELDGSAMIREVHVYGPALSIGDGSGGEAQHIGLGRRLIAEAKDHARAAGFRRLAVISAIGTRRYYERIGFERGDLYMSARL